MTTTYDELAAHLMLQGTATQSDVEALATRALEALGAQCPNCDGDNCESNEDSTTHRCCDCSHMWDVAS